MPRDFPPLLTRIGRATLLGLSLLVVAPTAIAEADAGAKGRAIAERAWERGEGFGDLQADVEMTIITRSGQSAKRRLQVQILEMPGEASRAMTRVEAPRDVAGTALLTHTAENGDVEQWLYLPAASRTRRISSAARGGSFLGSEFSYDDFAAQPPSRYEFEWLRDEALDGIDTHVLRREERDGDTPGHEVVWLDTEKLRLRQVQFFDARGEMTRVLTIDDYEAYEGADGETYWRATALRMDNARSDAASELRWEKVSLDNGLDERDFEVSMMSRRR